MERIVGWLENDSRWLREEQYPGHREGETECSVLFFAGVLIVVVGVTGSMAFIH